MHTSGDYLTQCSYTIHNIFAFQPDRDVFWCIVDPCLGHRAQPTGSTVHYRTT